MPGGRLGSTRGLKLSPYRVFPHESGRYPYKRELWDPRPSSAASAAAWASRTWGGRGADGCGDDPGDHCPPRVQAQQVQAVGRAELWIATVESVRTMHAGAQGSAPQDDWKPRRLGANMPEAEIALLERSFSEVTSACGIPPGLFAREDGAGQRESFRRFLHRTLDPIARLVGEELSTKFETPISLNLDRLFASDLAGRGPRLWKSRQGRPVD